MSDLRILYKTKLIMEEFGIDTSEIKKQIRGFNKRLKRPEPIIHYDNDGQGLWYKEIFKNNNVKEVQEYCDKYERLELRSSYDCTGRWFTRDIQCFQVGNDVIMYHFMGLDI